MDLRPHDFESLWVHVSGTGGGRQCVALVCKECYMRIDEPRYRFDKKTGETICGSLALYPATCEEYSIQYVHES